MKEDSNKWSLFLLSIGLLMIALSAVPGEAHRNWMLLVGIALAAIAGLFIFRKRNRS